MRKAYAAFSSILFPGSNSYVLRKDSTLKTKPARHLLPGVPGFAPVFARLHLSLALAVCALPAFAGQPADPSAAGQDLKALSLQQLGNVQVVTATKEPEEVWNTPDAIYVLTQDDIRRSGVTTVPDALRLVPGVEVARVSGDRNWAVGIRGFGDQFSKAVLVLLDGRNVYTPLFSGVYWTIDNVMIEDIDHIEVIRGPGGTIWGPNAENGVINIITKSSASTQGGLAAVGGGNVDQGTGDFRYGISNGANLSFRAYGMAFSRSAEYHPNGINYDDSRLGQVGFRSDWTSGRDVVTVQGDAYKGQLGDAQRISTFTPEGSYISYAPGMNTGGNILGRWRRDISPKSDLYLQAYWMRDYRIGSNFGETRDTFDIDFLHRLSVGDRNEFTYGVEARISPATLRRTVPTIGFTSNHLTDSIYSGFVQDVFSIAPGKLSLTIGSKLGSDSYSGFHYQPSGRLLWTPTPTRTIWAAVTRAVRVPGLVDANIDDDIYAGPGVYIHLVGNPRVRNEHVVSYDEGFRTLLKRNFFFDVTAFHNQYDDVIALSDPTAIVPATSPPPNHLLYDFTYVNGIHGTTDGFEIAPDWKPLPSWRLKAAYSYLTSDLSNKPFLKQPLTVTTYSGSSPSHQLVLQSESDFGRFSFDPTFRYVSHLPAQHVRAYSTADARLGWHLSKSVELSVTGQNLLQPHHGEFGIDPEPNVLIKRSVYAKLVWSR